MGIARTTPPSHYVRHNRVTRVPRNFIYFDSEANREVHGRGEVQTFRVAVAVREQRRNDNHGWAERQTGVFRTAAELWAWIDAHTTTKARTVCVAHNLAYDLRLTDGFAMLVSLGWELTDVRLDRGGTFAKWRRDGRTLVCMDSFAWLPTSLDRIGEMVEIPKLKLPDWEDTNDAWIERCTRDVDILATAGRRLVDWVRADDLGNWRPTGAGQSWSTFRHRFMAHRLLAHDDVDARAAERRAAWTGRCEVWRHGRPTGGPFAEFDYSAAYAHVGAECDVPTRLTGTSTTANREQVARLLERFAVLAEVTVTTDVPTLPARVDGKICWPVGTFTTTVWDTELALAIEHGATVKVERVWWYKREPALREFCRWVLHVLGPSGASFDPVIVAAVKHWSRALIGRFGARWSEWETIGRADRDGLGLSTVLDRVEGSTWRMLQVGRTLKRQSVEHDSADAVVSIMSWVMAEARVRLWRLVELAGAESVCYMDTDGLIVDREGAERLHAAHVPGLRQKGAWSTVELLAPRQIVLHGELRAAGVPKQSVRVGERTWEGEFWSGLSADLTASRADRVTIARRRVNVSGRDARRLHTANGGTEPIRMGGTT